MSEYIDKLQVTEKLKELAELNAACGYELTTLNLRLAANMIEHITAADVAPVVHGKWNGWHGDKACRRRSAVKSRFCPNCGAKMDGGDGDE